MGDPEELICPRTLVRPINHLKATDIDVAFVGRTNYRCAEGRCQSRSVKKTKDVKREDLWRFVMSNDLISLSIDNQLY
jgi:hypothetical protein